MRIEDMILVSVDDHVVEPPSMTEFFRERVPAKYRDRVPYVLRRPDGTDAWVVEGVDDVFAAWLCRRGERIRGGRHR